MPVRSAPHHLTASGEDWAHLLDEVSRGQVRVLLDSSSGGRVVLVSAGELHRLEEAALRAQGPRVVLTPRERQVLQRVEAGERTADIAVALELARGTVVQHLAAARRKYGVRTSREAAARAREAAELG